MININLPVRDKYSQGKPVLKVVKVNDLINACSVVPIEDETQQPVEVSQSRLENVRLYNINNSADDDVTISIYLNEDEVKLIDTICTELDLKKDIYCPTLTLDRAK